MAFIENAVWSLEKKLSSVGKKSRSSEKRVERRIKRLGVGKNG